MDRIPNEYEKREHLRKIINAARTGMFITHATGQLHGRPMANAEVSEPFSTIWFAASRSSTKVAELQKDNHVFLSYHGSGTEWAAVSGRGHIVEDRAKIRELWSPLWKVWFDSPEDPDIILIAVAPEFAEYWDSGNKLVAYTKFALGALTGKDLSQDDHQKVTL